MNNKNYNSINNDVEQGQSSYEKKIQPIKERVNEVTDIMKENMTKVLERGTKLDLIQNRSELLSSRANEFCVNSNRVRKKFWWKNIQTNIIFIVFIITFIVVIYLLLK